MIRPERDVFVSDTKGVSRQPINSGLPLRPHNSDLPVARYGNFHITLIFPHLDGPLGNANCAELAYD